MEALELLVVPKVLSVHLSSHYSSVRQVMGTGPLHAPASQEQGTCWKAAPASEQRPYASTFQPSLAQKPTRNVNNPSRDSHTPGRWQPFSSHTEFPGKAKALQAGLWPFPSTPLLFLAESLLARQGIGQRSRLQTGLSQVKVPAQYTTMAWPLGS